MTLGNYLWSCAYYPQDRDHIVVMQRFWVVFHGISQESLAFAWHKHEPFWRQLKRKKNIINYGIILYLICLCQNRWSLWIFCVFSDPSEAIADSENFPVTMVIIICASSLVVMAVVIGLLVMIRLSQSSRGPAVKDITADLARDNLAFDELEVNTLSMKSSEKPISTWTKTVTCLCILPYLPLNWETRP